MRQQKLLQQYQKSSKVQYNVIISFMVYSLSLNIFIVGIYKTMKKNHKEETLAKDICLDSYTSNRRLVLNNNITY